jgi:hypothetical protein
MPRVNAPPAPSFLHIDDCDEAKVQALLDRAVEVKALLSSGDRSFRPFQGGDALCTPPPILTSPSPPLSIPSASNLRGSDVVLPCQTLSPYLCSHP